MARRFTQRPRSGPKRSMVWLNVSLGRQVAIALNDFLLGSLNAAALALRPFTVVRTHLVVGINSDQTSASEDPLGAVGFIVSPDKSVALGVTAIPMPLTQADADFFVYQVMANKFVFVSGIGIVARYDMQYIVDSKAMRKVGNDDDIAIVWEDQSAVGSEILVMGRMLIKVA